MSKHKDAQITELSITRYSKDAWQKCYPEKNPEDWADSIYRDELLNFVGNVDYGLKEAGYSLAKNYLMKIATIDDEYFQWLGDKDDSQDTRADYANNMSYEDALRIAQNNELDCTYYVGLYPIYLGPDETEVKMRRTLSETTRLKFENYLRDIAPGFDTYVLKYCLEINYAASVEPELIKHAKHYFNSGAQLERLGWHNIYNKPNPGDITIYCIPIVFCKHHESMAFCPDVLFDDETDDITVYISDLIMTQEFFDHVGGGTIIPFDQSGLIPMIKKDLKMFVCDIEGFENFLVSSNHVSNFLNDARRMLEQEGYL